MARSPILRRVACLCLSLVLVTTACGARDRVAARRSTSTTATASSSTASSTSPVASSTTVPCPAVTAPLSSDHGSLVSSNQGREYLLSLPPAFDPRRPNPVLFDFHGSSSDMGQQAVYSGLPAKAAARGYVVVTPDGTGIPRGWELGGDLDYRFTEDLLAQLRTGMCVDDHRIFTAGISDGSAFSSLLACHAPFRFAAVAMVAATIGPVCPDDVRPAVIAFHGTADPIVHFAGGKVEEAAGRETGRDVPGAEGAITAWAAHDGCPDSPAVRKVGSDVIVREWAPCTGGAAVTFYRIEGGGHTWPGAMDLSKILPSLGPTTSSIDASALILGFFDAHPMP